MYLKKRNLYFHLFIVLFFLVNILQHCENSSDNSIVSPEGPDFKEVTVHDPDVIKTNNVYYVFGSHLASAKSKDLIKWKQISTRVKSGNTLIPDPYDELKQAFDWAKTETLWAGCVTQLEDGKYYFYYCACEGSSPRSALGLAAAENIEGPYQHRKILLKSGMNGKSEDGTQYDATKHPNVIDPHVFYDENGELWMVYGSYSGGIFIMEMDPQTGLPIKDQGYGKKLLGGNHARIEAPYIMYYPETDYYYLFLSYGGLTADGGYNMRVARSENPDGPYFDSRGKNMINAKCPSGSFFNDNAIEPYGAKLLGNFKLRKSEIGYVSPGHNSVYYDQMTSEMYIFFHTRFPGRGEIHNLRVHKLFINSQGWPVIAPHRYAGENGTSFSEDELIGKYQYVDHGRDISTDIKESSKIKLSDGGKISGAIDGEWELTDDFSARLTIAEEMYHGVFLRQWDAGLDKYVITFSAMSDQGITIWGSQY